MHALTYVGNIICSSSCMWYGPATYLGQVEKDSFDLSRGDHCVVEVHNSLRGGGRVVLSGDCVGWELQSWRSEVG